LRSSATVFVENREFSLDDPAQARATRRGLEHSSQRRFAVPRRRVRQVRALFITWSIASRKTNTKKMKTIIIPKIRHIKISLIVSGMMLALRSANAQCDPPPSGIVAWWPGEGNATDIVGTNNGSLIGGVTYASGEVGQAFQFDGTGYVDVPTSGALNSYPITMMAWINTTDAGDVGDAIFNKYFNGSYNGYNLVVEGGHVWAAYFVANGDYVYAGDPGIDGGEVSDGNWHHVAFTVDSSGGKVYLDGSLHNSLAWTGTPGPTTTTHDLLIGKYDTFSPNFVGLIDEPAIFSRALTQAEIQAVYSAGSAGMCRRPKITSEPQSQVGYLDQSVQFSVGAVPSSPPLSYQWQTNGAALPGATNQTLVLTNLQISNAGAYSVIVMNSYGSVTSAPPAILTVNNASIALYPGLTLYGNVGTIYGIQASTNLSDTNSWFNLANVSLTNTAQLWYDSIPASLSARFYRVVPGPITIP